MGVTHLLLEPVKNIFQLVCKYLGNNLIDDIAQRNRAMILKSLQILTFRGRIKKSYIMEHSASEKLEDNFVCL